MLEAKRWGWLAVAAGLGLFTGCGDGASGAGGRGSGGGGAASPGGGGPGGGGSGGATPKSGPTEAEHAACRDFETALCKPRAMCAPQDFEQIVGTQARCDDVYTKTYCDPIFADGSTDTAEGIASCVDEIAGFDCRDFLRAYFLQVPLCGFSPGTRAPGEPCGDRSQCQSRICDLSGACGTCGAMRAKLGEGCASDAECDFGLGCGGGTCVALRDVGEACDDVTAPCFVDLACNGTCAPLPVDGDPCVPFSHGSRLVCAFGSTCNAQQNRCEPVRAAAVGDACGNLPDGGIADCAFGGTCLLTDTTQGSGSCVPMPTEGEACDGLFFGFSCAFPARCVAGTCVVPDAYACN